MLGRLSWSFSCNQGAVIPEADGTRNENPWSDVFPWFGKSSYP